MNKPLKTPPSAFPVRFGKDDQFAEAGMTLRDWFAGQALESIADHSTLPSSLAIRAYALADAMIAERSK